AEAPQPDRARQVIEPRALFFGGEEVGARSRKQGFAEGGAGPRAHRRCRPCPANKGIALPTEEALADKRLVHEPEQRRAVPLQSDQGPPQGLSDDEGARAVDR